jgi:rSAM/selenodomain-associated transferase 2
MRLTSDPLSSPSETSDHLAVSLIVPVWRESETLWDRCNEWAKLPGARELIVAAVETIAPPAGCNPRIRVITCPEANRGAQQKLAADSATGEVLLFHHADSDLRAEHLLSLAEALRDRRIGAGAFVRAFDERHPRLKWLQRLAAWQQRRWGALYGDQSIFIRRSVYEAIGGFPPIPLMEDVEISRRLRRATRIALLEPPLATSARRHSRQGSWRTSLRNGTLLFLHRIGVSPFRLHRWYYRELQRRSIWSLIWSELICRREPAPPPPTNS